MSHSNTLGNFINDVLNNRREIKIIITKFHLSLLVNDNETYDQKALARLFQLVEVGRIVTSLEASGQRAETQHGA